jgi:predicted nucleic acid-binding protein
VDSNVAFKWEVPERDTDKALRLRDDYRTAVHELFAPDFFPVEVGHALARAERQNRIKPPDGWAAWLTIMTDKPVLLPSYTLMPRAYAIASAARHGVYDCLYIALAERETCELITADNALVKKLQPQFPFGSHSPPRGGSLRWVRPVAMLPPQARSLRSVAAGRGRSGVATAAAPSGTVADRLGGGAAGGRHVPDPDLSARSPLGGRRPRRRGVPRVRDRDPGSPRALDGDWGRR